MRFSITAGCLGDGHRHQSGGAALMSACRRTFFTSIGPAVGPHGLGRCAGIRSTERSRAVTRIDVALIEGAESIPPPSFSTLPALSTALTPSEVTMPARPVSMPCCARKTHPRAYRSSAVSVTNLNIHEPTMIVNNARPRQDV